jgi:hypothetical protein
MRRGLPPHGVSALSAISRRLSKASMPGEEGDDEVEYDIER